MFFSQYGTHILKYIDVNKFNFPLVNSTCSSLISFPSVI